MYYSGCNYWINQGKNEFEPKGTATSMHDCEGCEDIKICGMKRKTDIWKYNEEIKEFLDEEIKKIAKNRNERRSL